MVDRFTFAREVHGSGGFADVVRGRDNVLERDVAVKFLTPLATEFPEIEHERFRREARILASLSHPNIPSIYDVSFSAGEQFLIIFQFIEGSNLREIINNEPLVDSGESRLEYASERFLELLLNLCLLVEKDSYRGIVIQAVSWAFEKQFNEQIGRGSIRRSLEKASHEASGEAYEVLREEFENFLERTELDEQEEWYLHAVRNVVQNLLANPACINGESVLVEVLRKVNQIQRSRSRASDP